MYYGDEHWDDNSWYVVDGFGDVSSLNCGETLNDGLDDSIIPLQFTGLKDKNCKEIYEGDIIHVIHFDHVEGHGKVKVGTSKEVVTYDESMAGYLPFADGSCVTDVNSDWDDWEVIGNIYENKDLLE